MITRIMPMHIWAMLDTNLRRQTGHGAWYWWGVERNKNSVTMSRLNLIVARLSWRNSPEGIEFWESVYNEYKPNKP